MAMALAFKIGNHADHLCCSPLPLSEDNPMPAANKAEIVLWGAEQVGKTCRRRWEMMGRYGTNAICDLEAITVIMVEGLFLVNKVIAVLGEFSAVPWRARSAPSVTVAILGVVSIWKPKSKVFQFLFWSILNFRDTCASNMVTLFFLKSSVWMCRGGNPSHQQGMDETVSDCCSRRV